MSEATTIETSTGRLIDPCAPVAALVSIDDIAHHLAWTCRFTGACDPWYSVAEHSVRVSWRVAELLKGEGMVGEMMRRMTLAGLLHDAAEAYIGDMSSPLKKGSPMGAPYKAMEINILVAIEDHFNLHGLLADKPRTVDHADRELLATERRDLMPRCAWQWESTLPSPLPGKIEAWTHTEARARFMDEYRKLTEGTR